MKNTGLYIVAGKPSMMRADIQTVPLSIIRNAFQVILQYGITVTCSEIFKGSCFTIHEVQSSPLQYKSRCFLLYLPPDSRQTNNSGIPSAKGYPYNERIFPFPH